ncbi:peroxisomal ATPase PEX6-like [Hydractinia symbiolongicarpus]|uniref:peroxisomal ATPase PEX6-like n=1 Tax=Hydractinia symbiolongicarpus TaxID=13093 RepID=UPI00254BC41C|nr:peroxisomal ATPase PEX6-like [Hydractinia symbiolongicarpus]
MVVLRVNPSIGHTHRAYVTANTLLHLNVLNESWVRVTLNSEDRHKNKKNKVAEKFHAFEESKNDYVLQLTLLQANNEADDLYELFKEIDQLCDGEQRISAPQNGSIMDNDGTVVYEDDVMYVSTIALFNIAKQDVNLYKKCRTADFTVTFSQLEDFTATKKVYFANNVEISAVSCAYGSVSDDMLSETLKDHFEQTKVLSQGEVFSIDLEKKQGEKFHLPRHVSFKVNSLKQNEDRRPHHQTNFLFVNSHFSNLYLCSPVKCYVPECPCTFQNNVAQMSLFRSSYFQNAFIEVVPQMSKIMKLACSNKVPAKETLILLEGARGVGKGLLTRSLCFKHCIHFHEENCFDLIGESLSATERRIENLFQLVKSASPCLLYLKNIHLLCKDKEGVHEERRVLQCFLNQLRDLVSNAQSIMVIGSTYCSKEMSPRFYSEFVYHFEIEPPNEIARESIITALLENESNRNFSLTDLAKKTAGFIFSDFMGLFRRAANENLFGVNGAQINKSNIEQCIEEIRALKAGSSDSVKIPKVTWNDVGGLQSVKADIMDTLELPVKFPKLFANGLQRSGLLFYGPPGCGKTLLAKAIATEFTLNFYSVKGPELINMYVGQSEENVREVFKKARSMAPCIIFFDELDSLAPNRGRSGDSGGVMDRIVSQLLSELDGMHDNTDVFVVGATNRPDLLDNALLRPGRFDKLVYVGIPEGIEERIKILKAVTRKIKLAEDVKMDFLETSCPVNLTGADFYALASDATMNCFRRLISEHEEKRTPLNCEEAVVTMADFEAAIRRTTPSVSLIELDRYKTMKEEIQHKK